MNTTSQRRASALVVGFVALALAAPAPGEVLLRPTPGGALLLDLADGTELSWFQFISGANFAQTTSADAFLVDRGMPAFDGEPRRLHIPARSADGGMIELTESLRLDDAEPELLHFEYEFASDRPTVLNTAGTGLGLPVAEFATATVGGPAGRTAVLPVDRPEVSTLLRAGGTQLECALGAPRGWGLILDRPTTLDLMDLRSWGVQFYRASVVALGPGTDLPLNPDQPAAISGRLQLAEPIRVTDVDLPEPGPPPLGEWAMRAAATYLAFENAGQSLVRVSNVVRTNDARIVPVPARESPDDETVIGEVTVANNLRLENWNIATPVFGATQLDVEATILNTAGGLRGYGVAIDVSPELGAAMAVFLREPEPMVLLPANAEPGHIARARCAGVELRDVQGRTLFSATGDDDGYWSLHRTADGLRLMLWITGGDTAADQLQSPPAGSTFSATVELVVDDAG